MENIETAAPYGARGEGTRKSHIGIAALIIGAVAIASTFLSSAIVIGMSRRADGQASAERDAREEEHRSRIQHLRRTSESISHAGVAQITKLFFMLHMKQLKAFGLTEREARIAMLAAVGETSAAIAKRLSVSDSTVKHYLGSAYRKTNTKSRQELRSLLRSMMEQDRSS